MKPALVYSTADLLLKSEVTIKQGTKILHLQSNKLYQYIDIASTPKLNISRLEWAIENNIRFVSHPGLKSSKPLVCLYCYEKL